MRTARLLILVATLIALVSIPQPAAAKEQCFGDKTEFCLNSPFQEYWNANGGLSVFGYPITTAAPERNRDTGQTYNTQWLERNRFEVHPENAGTPYEILLGLLGKERLAQLGVNWQDWYRDDGPRDGCLWFEETGHNVCDRANGLGFKTYWESHGLNIPSLSKYEQSLQLFGLPLTPPYFEMNTSGDYVETQWFERARFEWHPKNPTEFKVQLGLLGKEVLKNEPRPDENLQTLVVQENYTVTSPDDQGNRRIVGQVGNATGFNISFIDVFATFYDANNNKLEDVYGYGWSYRDTLKPGQKAPFEYVLPVSMTYDHVIFEAYGHVTQYQPLDQLTISNDQMSMVEGRPNVRKVTFDVRNDTNKSLEYIGGDVTLFNDQGQVVGIGYVAIDDENFVNLQPGQTTSMFAYLFDWTNGTHYEIHVDGFEYHPYK